MVKCASLLSNICHMYIMFFFRLILTIKILKIACKISYKFCVIFKCITKLECMQFKYERAIVKLNVLTNSKCSCLFF